MSSTSAAHGHLSDEKLLESVQSLRFAGRQLDVQLLLRLAEIEERRLHLRLACASIFDFCRRKLHMSEGESSRRMVASRLVRKLPGLIPHIEAGRIHLTTLLMLRDFVAEDNIEELITATYGKTKEKVKELLAARAPRPDVPSRIRKLPERAAPLSAPASPAAPASPNVSASPNVPASPSPLEPSAAAAEIPSGPGSPWFASAQSGWSTPARPARIEPLAPSRYKLEMTIGAVERETVERVRALMRHRLPSGDLAAIFGEALELLLAKLEKERLGVTSRRKATAKPAKPPKPAKPAKPRERMTRYIPRALRRTVFERDGEQCTFCDPHGHRCPARTLLELDHIHAVGHGGESTLDNLRVRCRAHNRLHAEDCFGAAHVAQRIETRQRKTRQRDSRQRTSQTDPRADADPTHTARRSRRRRPHAHRARRRRVTKARETEGRDETKAHDEGA